MHAHGDSWIDLYWIPLGAGGHVVKWNGRLYEAFAARRAHRPRRELYHSALSVGRAGTSYVVEMAPVWNLRAPDRGAVCTGAVGAQWLGRWRAFQYEVRAWRDGYIPDLAEAVASPVRLSEEDYAATKLLEALPQAPTFVWGRDVFGIGDMWSSNSLISWALARTGLAMDEISPPFNGRAPGWDAGLALARQQSRLALSAAAGNVRFGTFG